MTSFAYRSRLCLEHKANFKPTLCKLVLARSRTDRLACLQRVTRLELTRRRAGSPVWRRCPPETRAFDSPSKESQPPIERSVVEDAYCCLHGSDQAWHRQFVDRRADPAPLAHKSRSETPPDYPSSSGSSRSTCRISPIARVSCPPQKDCDESTQGPCTRLRFPGNVADSGVRRSRMNRRQPTQPDLPPIMAPDTATRSHVWSSSL